jgi:hypothetical protein
MTRNTARLWLCAVLLALGNWAYVLGLEEPSIRARAVANGLVFSSEYSDLYHSWRATREMLWQARDPYSKAVTEDIYTGLVGRAALPGEPIPLSAQFSYPLYFAFLVAPLTLVPYGTLMPWLYAVGVLLIALSALAWCWALGLRRLPGIGVLVLLASSSLPAIHAVVIIQPVIISVACLAGVILSFVRRAQSQQRRVLWYALAGSLLAVSTVKPQCSILLVGALMVWALGAIRERWGFMLGLTLTLGALLLGAEALSPGWLPRWLAVLSVYQSGVGVQPLLFTIFPILGNPAVLTVAGLLLAAGIWRLRAVNPHQLGFQLVVAAPLLISYLVFASWEYQQLLLYPAILLVIAQRRTFEVRGRFARLLYAAIVSMTLWPFLGAAAGAVFWLIRSAMQQPVLDSEATLIWGILRLPLIALPFALLAQALVLVVATSRGAAAAHLPIPGENDGDGVPVRRV